MITANDLIRNEDLEYAISIRRELHRNPELGFDLPKTVALVKRELEKIGMCLVFIAISSHKKASVCNRRQRPSCTHQALFGEIVVSLS